MPTVSFSEDDFKENQDQGEPPLPCPVPGCAAKTKPGILREWVICPVHGEQWVGEEDEL